MRLTRATLFLCLSLLYLLPVPVRAQAAKFPPDSLVNTQVIPRNTPVMNVIGQMRNFTFALGVRCQYCHVGREGMPLDSFDFVSDEKRTKRTAREMLRMVQAINGQHLSRVPERPTPAVDVECQTCHRGVARPMPLSGVLLDVATASGADSAVRAYRELRTRHYGRDAYDFGENTLNTAAFRLGRAGKYEEALALLRLNEEQYPGRGSMYITMGNVNLMRGDTTAAAEAFREAVRRNPQDQEARGRLRTIGRAP